MGYQIVYLPTGRIQSRIKTYFRLPALILLSFILFFVLVTVFWPAGAAVLKTTVFGEEAKTVSALYDLAEDLEYGKGIKEALQDFSGKLIS